MYGGTEKNHETGSQYRLPGRESKSYPSEYEAGVLLCD